MPPFAPKLSVRHGSAGGNRKAASDVTPRARNSIPHSALDAKPRRRAGKLRCRPSPRNRACAHGSAGGNRKAASDVTPRTENPIPNSAFRIPHWTQNREGAPENSDAALRPETERPPWKRGRESQSRIRRDAAGAELNSAFRIGRKTAKARRETPMPSFAPKPSVRPWKRGRESQSRIRRDAADAELNSAFRTPNRTPYFTDRPQRREYEREGTKSSRA